MAGLRGEIEHSAAAAQPGPVTRVRLYPNDSRRQQGRLDFSGGGPGVYGGELVGGGWGGGGGGGGGGPPPPPPPPPGACPPGRYKRLRSDFSKGYPCSWECSPPSTPYPCIVPIGSVCVPVTPAVPAGVNPCSRLMPRGRWSPEVRYGQTVACCPDGSTVPTHKGTAPSPSPGVLTRLPPAPPGPPLVIDRMPLYERTVAPNGLALDKGLPNGDRAVSVAAAGDMGTYATSQCWWWGVAGLALAVLSNRR